jgi:hypothetical protein
VGFGERHVVRVDGSEPRFGGPYRGLDSNRRKIADLKVRSTLEVVHAPSHTSRNGREKQDYDHDEYGPVLLRCTGLTFHLDHAT